MATKDSFGKWGEEYAARYLKQRGFDIIRRKTAYLFGGCAQIGGMLGGGLVRSVF